jgi:hypothetical protein
MRYTVLEALDTAVLTMIGVTQFAAADIDTTAGGPSYFNQGYSQGRSDHQANLSYNDFCDPNNNAVNPGAACASYKTGYATGWAAYGVIYGNQQPRQ